MDYEAADVLDAATEPFFARIAEGVRDDTRSLDAYGTAPPDRPDS